MRRHFTFRLNSLLVFSSTFLRWLQIRHSNRSLMNLKTTRPYSIWLKDWVRSSRRVCQGPRLNNCHLIGENNNLSIICHPKRSGSGKIGYIIYWFAGTLVNAQKTTRHHVSSVCVTSRHNKFWGFCLARMNTTLSVWTSGWRYVNPAHNPWKEAERFSIALLNRIRLLLNNTPI